MIPIIAAAYLIMLSSPITVIPYTTMEQCQEAVKAKEDITWGYPKTFCIPGSK